jgi:hypothetical protein
VFGPYPLPLTVTRVPFGPVLGFRLRLAVVHGNDAETTKFTDALPCETAT